MNLSIRYKILILLTILPLLTLGLYLMMATKVFEADKIAYVFESSTAVSKTLSSQVSTELNSAVSSLRPVLQEFFSERKFAGVSKSIVESDNGLLWIAAFENNDGQFKEVGIVEKTEGEGLNEVSEFKDLNKFLSDGAIKERYLRVPFADDRIWFVENISDTTNNKNYTFIASSRLSHLAESFRVPGNTESYLLGENGEVLFGPASNESAKLSDLIGAGFLERAQGKKFNTGTEQVVNNRGETLLASFSKSDYGNISVVSLVNKGEALRAVDILKKKSLIFFGLLLSATAIISLFASGTLTRALTELFHATKKVAEGQFDIRVKVKGKDEIGSLATSFNAMAEEVQRLLLETAEKARMQGELKTAKTVQETLFPPTHADIENVEIAGYYEPASECGGDWWHYSKVENKIFLWIGDATGHGAPAALITSAAKSAATIIERLNVEPAEALNMLNKSIYDVSKGRIMMTFFLASYDVITKEFVYANASHESPYLINKTDQILKKKSLIPLNEVNNPRLGQSRDTVYQQTKLTLDLGDRILFYTDGIPDIQNPEKTSWGEREFIKSILSSNKDFPPVSDSVKIMSDQFSEYRKGASLIDDITFFMFRVKEG